MCAWAIYMTGDHEFARFYFPGIGYYGSVIAYAVPWIFSVTHMAVTLGGNNNGFPGGYTLWLIVVQLAMWLACGIIHIVYVPEFEAYLELVSRQSYVIKEVIPTVESLDVPRPLADDPIEVIDVVDEVVEIVDEETAGDGW